MTFTTNCTNLVKEFEGLYLTAYYDAVGVITIGYGHTGDGVYDGLTITTEQAVAWLEEDLLSSAAHVDSYTDIYSWNQNQFDALTSFAFNVGNINGLTAKGTRTISEIAEKILEYNKGTVNGKKVELKGLTRRRKAEYALFTSTEDLEIEDSNPDNTESEHTGTVMPTGYELRRLIFRIRCGCYGYGKTLDTVLNMLGYSNEVKKKALAFKKKKKFNKW